MLNKFEVTNDLKIAAISILAIFFSSLGLVETGPSLASAPEKSAQRRPSNTQLANQLVKLKLYIDLNRQERRVIYNAVIYFCNEEPDPQACEAYVSYCGKSCELLMLDPRQELAHGPPSR